MDWHPSSTPIAARKGSRRDGEGLWEWNLVSDRIHFSPGWMSLVGCLDHEIGNTVDDWFKRVHADDRTQLLADIDVARANGADAFEFRYRMRHKDGAYRWMCSRGLIVRNERGEAVKLTGAQADVTVETVTDPVTGLPNGLLLQDRLAQSIARARRHTSFHFALVLIEIGRPSGPTQASRPGLDPLLNAAARRLETCLRSPDAMSGFRQTDLVAYVDGDLFAVLLDGLGDLGDAKVVADRVLAEMLNPFTLSSREVRLSPAIGVALSATGYAHPDEALRDAETALHRARVLGGSHCEVFDAEVLKSEQSVLQLESELELALERGELQLAYQPIVSLAAGEVVGFEALVRWRHPVLGIVSPLDFIPIAERNGLIVSIGRWILQEACTQLRAWQTSIPAARELWISVNLSGVQMREADFIAGVEEVLRRSDLQARHLVLEITEGVAMDNPVAVTTLLMRLRATGIRISVDDFGTGYSSLAYLRQFPVDGLKIDQSFVRGIAHDKGTVAIVTSIVAMAKELGLSVVAEGVEKDNQLDVLQSLGCESAQGYLFAPPLDAAGAEDFLNTGPIRGVESPTQAAMAGHEGRVPQWLAATLSRAGREVLVTGAVLVVLLSVGAGALFYRAEGTRAGTTPSDTQAVTSEKPPAVISQKPTVPSEKPLAVAEKAPASAVKAPALSEKPPAPSGGAPVSSGDTPKAASLSPARDVTSPSSVPAPPPPVATKPAPSASIATPVSGTSFDVLHLHRLGKKCRGRLIVSRAGVSFVPDKKGSDDAVTLKAGEFVQSVDEKVLTIRSANKDYRFTIAAATPGNSVDTQLAKLTDTLAHSRDK